MDPLVLRRTISADGQWTGDDYDVLSEGEVVGRIQKVIASPEDTPWMWSLGYGHHRARFTDARLRVDAGKYLARVLVEDKSCGP